MKCSERSRKQLFTLDTYLKEFFEITEPGRFEKEWAKYGTGVHQMKE